MNFHDYQINASNKVIDFLNDSGERILLHSPTGSGKTFIGGKIIIDLPEKFKKVLFIVNKEALLLQAYKTLYRKLNIPCFIVHNKINKDRDLRPVNKDGTNCKVLITLIGSSDNIPDDFVPDLIIIDEAHKGTASSFQGLVEQYGVPVVGLTATPHRAKDKDGESLHEWYGDNLISTIPYKELVERGFLTPLKYVALTDEAHVVNTWLHYTNGHENKRTILFTRDTRHSLEMKEAFLKNGITAEIITSGDEEGLVANQSTEVRNEIFNKFEAGQIDVLISVIALCEGFDEPLAKFCFICRRIADANVALFHQICGRVSRPCEGKDYGYVIDFGDNYVRFGTLEDYEYTDLAYSNPVKVVSDKDKIHAGVAERRRLMVRCKECQHVYDLGKGARCIHCDTKNNVTVYSNVGDLRNQLLKHVNRNTFEKFKAANKFQGKSEANEVKAIKHLCMIMARAQSTRQEAVFNKIYFEAFDPITYEPKFNWANKINMKTRMEDTVEWELYT